jgi:hypothetical protein
MKQLICILFLGLLSNSIQAQSNETKAKIRKIEGDWKIDSKSGNVYYYRLIKKLGKSDDELFKSIKDYIPQFYQSIKMLYNDKKYDTVKIDSIEHQIVVKGRSGIVYSLFSSDLFTQDIFHILTINVYKDSVGIKIEHTTFRKYVGLRNPKSEDIELKNVYPINTESNDKDFYGNSFYNLNNKTMTKLNDFVSYVQGL